MAALVFESGRRRKKNENAFFNGHKHVKCASTPYPPRDGSKMFKEIRKAHTIRVGVRKWMCTRPELDTTITSQTNAFESKKGDEGILARAIWVAGTIRS